MCNVWFIMHNVTLRMERKPQGVTTPIIKTRRAKLLFCLLSPSFYSSPSQTRKMPLVFSSSTGKSKPKWSPSSLDSISFLFWYRISSLYADILHVECGRLDSIYFGILNVPRNRKIYSFSPWNFNQKNAYLLLWWNFFETGTSWVVLEAF